MTDEEMRASVQAEAERTFDAFIMWSKRVILYAIIILLVVVVGCDSGVDKSKRYPGYNGEQYDL